MNDYINNVLSQIKNKSARPLIEQELQSHIQDRVEYFTELGYSTEEAECKAVEAMGEPDNTAIPLDSLHNDRWYKRPELYFAMGFLVVQFVIAMFFAKSFKYADGQIVHYITFDFISAILLVWAFLLVKICRKRHNISAVAVTLFGVILSIFTGSFQPAMYAVSKIFRDGFLPQLNDYVRSIFTYGVSYSTNASLMKHTSIAFTVILIIYCICTIVRIRRKQCCKRYILSARAYRIFERLVSIILAVNISIMTIGIVTACVNYDTISHENEMLRRKCADFVIGFDTKSNCKSDFKKFAKSMGNMVENNNGGITVCYSNNDNVLIWLTKWNENDYSINYSRTDIFTNHSPISRSKLLKESDFKKYVSLTFEVEDDTTIMKQYSLSKSNDAYNLQDFINDDIYYNATFIAISTNGKLIFSFLLDDNQNYERVELCFSNKKLETLKYYKKEWNNQ